MTIPTPAYTAPAYTVPAAPLTVLNALATAGQRAYRSMLWRVDDTGAMLEDLTPYVARLSSGAAPTVGHDSTAECPGKLTIGVTKDLRWGFDRVMPWLLVRSRGYAAGAWQAFPCGIYVATTPGTPDLDRAGVFDVTGWDRCYLLQSSPAVTLSFAAGSTYGDAVRNTMRAAGVLGAAAALATIVAYPGDWYGKTLATPSNYPVGSGTNHLQIVNELLKASGMRPLFTDPASGQFAIQAVTVPSAEALRWWWQGGALPTPPTAIGDTGWPDRKVVQYGRQQYVGDVYNAPNQWMFVQEGLGAQPGGDGKRDGTSGLYLVDNNADPAAATVGGSRLLAQPPTDQYTVGRVVRKSVVLDASGPTDLKTQGDAIVAADLATFEKVQLATAPWPAAGHFDVFNYVHPLLPDWPIRRLQAQSWSMPLGRGEMTWETNVVGLQ